MEPTRPRVSEPTTYGNPKFGKFWVEYPTGLVDTSTNHHIGGKKPEKEPDLLPGELEFSVQGDRRVRLDVSKSALVVIDMQNFFLHPDLRSHPLGLECVQPLVKLVPFLRKKGVRIIWCNWGLTNAELLTIPPSLARSFSKGGTSGFGSNLPGGFGKVLLRGEKNSELYGPLQEMYLEGEAQGCDIWIHKNRMSGIWGAQSALDLHLKSQGIETLLFAGVNADQCVLGTICDAYNKGYNCIILNDCIATTSPDNGKSSVVYNCARSYGFVTDHDHIIRE